MSKIECIASNNTIRSKRSELMSFFCEGCEVIHEDYPIKNAFYINDELGFMCREIVEHLLND